MEWSCLFSLYYWRSGIAIWSKQSSAYLLVVSKSRMCVHSQQRGAEICRALSTQWWSVKGFSRTKARISSLWIVGLSWHFKHSRYSGLFKSWDVLVSSSSYLRAGTLKLTAIANVRALSTQRRRRWNMKLDESPNFELKDLRTVMSFQAFAIFGLVQKLRVQLKRHNSLFRGLKMRTPRLTRDRHSVFASCKKAPIYTFLKVILQET